MKLSEPSLASKALRQPPLSQDFYLLAADRLAPSLIGKYLFKREKEQILLARITEVEAYLGSEDPASHAYRGQTPRNAPMFKAGGTCYVYFIYGMYYCANVVAGDEGIGQAVLLRAAEPVLGKEIMRKRRGLTKNSDAHLLSGPGKLAQAFGLSKKDSGRTFLEEDFKIIELPVEAFSVHHSVRIGISKNAEASLRFFEAESPWVSHRKIPGKKYEKNF